MQNKKRAKNNTSGITGVGWDKQRKRWRTEVQLHSKKIFLGLYPSRLDAALARLTFEIDCPDWHCDTSSSALRFVKEKMPDHDFSLVEKNLYNKEDK